MRMVLTFLLSLSLVSQAQADELSASESKQFSKLVRKAQRTQHAGERLAKRIKTQSKAMEKYKSAASSYIEAYQIKNASSILFLLAEIYKTRSEVAWAVRGYQRYLEIDPDGQYNEACEERLAEIGDLADLNKGGDPDIDPTPVFGEASVIPAPLEEVPESTEPVPEVETVTKTPPVEALEPKASSSGKTLRYSGVGSVALGLVFVGIGVKFGLDASSASDELSAKEGAWTAADRTKISDGESDETKSLIFTLVGAAGILGGGYLYYIGHKRDRLDVAARASQVVPVLARKSVSLHWAGNF